jgi:hypothetical protein
VSLFSELEEYFSSQTITEYYIVFDCTYLVWETLRFRRLKAGIVRNNQRAAAEKMFCGIYKGKELKRAIDDYFSSPEFAAQTQKDFETMGLCPDAIGVEALQRSLSPLAEIERQIASAQKRLATFTKELEQRLSDRVSEFNRAAMAAARR